MKKITCIVLFLCGLTVASNAQNSSETEIASANTEAKVLNNDLSASVVGTQTRASILENNLSVSTVGAASTVTKDAPLKTSQKKWKKWKDKTIAGKVLVVVGGTVFIVLCLLFGTVSVG